MTNPRRLLERDIERQLRSGPKLHADRIFASGNPSALSLLDAIDLHGERCGAWETESRAGSGATTAHDATARLFTEHIRKHSPATERVVSNQVRVPTGIGLRLHDGSVTLEGQITWNYRRDAERAIQYLSNAIGHPLEPQCPGPYAAENPEGALSWLPADAPNE